MTCSAIQPLLDACLDGELDASQQLLIREHLETCASCTSSYASLKRLQDLVRSSPLQVAAPEALRKNVIASIRRSATTQPVLPWKWLTMAASLLLALSLSTNVVLTTRYRVPDQTVATEILDGHLRSLLGTHLIDVASSDRHTVKPWFAGKLDFSPDVKDLAAQGFPLLGGRIDYLNGRPAAALVFRRAQHVINLFTWPSASSNSGSLSHNGYHLVAWTKDGMTYWAVSDLNLSELQQFAALYKN